ncbi:MAG: hypothetical protein AB7R89_03905 [Dehalococcoidia bacterium]
MTPSVGSSSTTLRVRQTLKSLRLVRNVDAGALLELFLVYAVAAILGIRIYLELTGYPQVGGDGLHIAHMLWGGLLMLISMVVLIAFLGKSVVRLGAILGGLGFGIFIDELGKFITTDNNYFYRPTFALIYIIFVVLFLVFRMIDRNKILTQTESLVNALDIVKELVRHDLDSKEKHQALALLAHSDQRDPVVIALQQSLEGATPAPNKLPDPAVRLARSAHDLYLRVIGMPWFARALIVIFAFLAVADILNVIGTVVSDPLFKPGAPNLSFTDWGDLISSGVFAGLVVAGIVRLRRSRVLAYRWFRRAMLVAIFFSQVFSFYSEQLVAIVGLMINLLLLGALNYTISEEEEGAESIPVIGAPASSPVRV